MDVGEVLRAAREQRGWSQARLAEESRTSRAAISAYESGRKSPTVATLDRVLAAAGLQVRAELEPLHAPLQERLDAVTARPGPLGEQLLGDLRRVAQALEGEHPYTVDRGWGQEPERSAGVLTWGVDADAALRLHGLGVTPAGPGVALLLDDVARSYLFRQRVRGTGGPAVSWFEASVAQAQQHLGEAALGPFGLVQVRLLDAPPETVRLEVAPGLVVPVLTLDEVERGRPELRELLDGLRARRAEGRQGRGQGS